MSKINAYDSIVSLQELDLKSVKSSNVSSVITHKYLEDNHPMEKFKSDNVIASTKNYLVKNYKPNPRC